MFWILVGILLLTLFYYFGIKPLTYWRERGVKQDNLLRALNENYFALFKQRTLPDFITSLYRNFPGTRYYGLYQFNRPSMLVKDIDLLKQLLIKDFEHFNEHRAIGTEETDPIWSKNLFSLKNNEWRNMRSTLSPSFTSSKMKGMFILMQDAAEKFVNFFLDKNEDLIEIEIKDTASRYCTDVIASTAFGLEVDSLANPNNEFLRKGNELINMRNFKTMVRFFFILCFPTIAKIFNISLVTPDVEAFFTNLIEETIKMREEKGLVRHDMVHLLLEARKGNVKSEEHHNITDTGFATVQEHLKVEKNINISNEDIIAQALVFFFAGFDSSSTLMTFFAYELCINQHIQDKLREEIEDTLNSCNNKLTYEALVNMKYMDMVITESLRKWPVQPAVERICTKPYTIQPTLPEEQPVHLPLGSSIIIPTYGIHHDPEFFPDPEVFDPERFSDENKANIKPYSFQPFGIGPRNCIGSRFALLETKIVFFHILRHFKIVPIEKTAIPLKMATNLFSMLPKEGLHMGFKRIS